MQILSVNLTRRLVHLDIGDAQITNMIDFEGDETNDPEQAVIVVAYLPNGYWASIDIERVGPTTFH